MIIKFMVSVGPIHERDLASVVKKLEHYPDIRVSTYGVTKTHRVIQQTGKRTHKKVTPEGIEAMQKLRNNGNDPGRISSITGYSRTTVNRYTRKRFQELKL